MSSQFTRRAFIGGTAVLVLGVAVAVRLLQPFRGKKKTKWVIGFSNASETNTWRTALREAIQETVDKHQGVSLFITDANDSPSKQLADLEDLLAKGVNGLIVGAATTDVAGAILNQCESEGIPVVIVDRKISGDKYTTLVSADNYSIAFHSLRKLIELISGKGKIALVEGIPGSGPAVERNAAYDAVLERHPAIEAVRQAGDWSRASGQRVIENILIAHRDLDGIHFDGGEMALGGIQALREAGVTDDMMRDGRPFITSQDNYNGWLKMIVAGIGKYTMTHPPRIHGRESVKALIKALSGEPIPKQWLIESVEITPENVADYVAMDKPDDFWAY